MMTSQLKEHEAFQFSAIPKHHQLATSRQLKISDELTFMTPDFDPFVIQGS